MKYLKQFNTETDYLSFKDSTNWVTPNVSWIKEMLDNSVRYSTKILPKYRIYCVYDIDNTSSETRLYNKSCAEMTEMIVDGVKMLPQQSYKFDTTGNHSVEFCFSSPVIDTTYLFSYMFRLSEAYISDEITSLADGMFKDCGNLSTVVFGRNVTNIGDYTLQNCSNMRRIVVCSDNLPSTGSNSFDLTCNVTVNGYEDITVYYSYRTNDRPFSFGKPTWKKQNALTPLTFEELYFEKDEISLAYNVGTYALLYGTGDWQYVRSYPPNDPYHMTFGWEELITNDVSAEVGLVYDHTVQYLDKTATISVRVKESTSTEPGDGCFIEGTLVMLADGSQKKVEDLTSDDLIAVWDFENGTLTSTPMIFIEKVETYLKTITYLTFSDDTVIGIYWNHCFYDCDLNKFVEITTNNFNDYIGHTFMHYKDGVLVKEQLVSAENKQEWASVYSLTTNKHFGHFINNYLSAPGGVYGVINVYPTNSETMMIDYDLFEQEKQMYGLYTYDEFCKEIAYVPEEVFYAFNAETYKILLGKQVITIPYVQALIKRYEPFWL